MTSLSFLPESVMIL